jgi:uncharacterized repeat protein (TIGR04076 family)
MPYDPSAVKITVLKRTVNRELVEAFARDPESYGPCGRYVDGQEFILENPLDVPEGLCPWAWANMRRDILALAAGASFPWYRQPGMGTGICADALRPVYFKIERLGAAQNP